MHDDGMMATAIFARTASCCMHGNQKVQETSLLAMQIRPNVRNRTLTFSLLLWQDSWHHFLPNLCDSFFENVFLANKHQDESWNEDSWHALGLATTTRS
jgi:hypothetical protein